MNIAAGVIAIIAGLIALVAAFVTLFVGGIGGAVGSEGAETVVGLGWGGVFFSFMVIVFGAMSFKGGKKTSIALIICSILGAILGGTLVAIFMVLALIAGVLGLIGSKNKESTKTTEVKDNTEPVQAQELKKNNSVLKIIGGVLAVLALIGFLSGKSDEEKVEPIDPIEELAFSEVDNSISPVGYLSEMFSLNSKSTDLQREQTLKELKGKVVVWSLPVFEVEKSNDGKYYKVQTESTINLFEDTRAPVGTFINLYAQGEADENVIMRLKTGNVITIKGQLVGDTSLRNLEISPAILWSDEKHNYYRAIKAQREADKLKAEKSEEAIETSDKQPTSNDSSLEEVEVSKEEEIVILNLEKIDENLTLNNQMPNELIGKYVTTNNIEACKMETLDLLEIQKDIAHFGFDGSFTPVEAIGSNGRYTIKGSLAFEGEETSQTREFILHEDELTVDGTTYIKCLP